MEFDADPRRRDTRTRILLACMVGTTIEYFDFYIYAIASVVVFPKQFFKPGAPTASALASLATFGLAFVARPFGAALFGHFGDRVGRKASLVASLSTMGLSTLAIGLLPTYGSIGPASTILLTLCRFLQGIGLGGENGGAVLLAIESAPEGQRAWWGMFPQLGAPLGFLLSTLVFLLLSRFLDDSGFIGWGWRLPFLASALLVVVGLAVRSGVPETTVFERSRLLGDPRGAPVSAVLAARKGALLCAVLSGTTTFTLFYVGTVFALGWGTRELGMGRSEFMALQCCAVFAFAAVIPLAARAAAARRRPVLIAGTVATIVYGLLFKSLFEAGVPGALAMMVLALGLVGVAWSCLGTFLAELFPTAVRYTGCSLALGLAGILGASLAPFLATWLADAYGLAAVGAYLSVSAVVSLVALLAAPETSGMALDDVVVGGRGGSPCSERPASMLASFLSGGNEMD